MLVLIHDFEEFVFNVHVDWTSAAISVYAIQSDDRTPAFVADFEFQTDRFVIITVRSPNSGVVALFHKAGSEPRWVYKGFEPLNVLITKANKQKLPIFPFWVCGIVVKNYQVQ